MDTDGAKPDSVAVLGAVVRLVQATQKDTGQAKRCADFLLAWHNAEENGAWDPTELWNVDAPIRGDMLLVLTYLAHERKYPEELGFPEEIRSVWRQWRGAKVEAKPRRTD